jgi:hypothetical protein
MHLNFHCRLGIGNAHLCTYKWKTIPHFQEKNAIFFAENLGKIEKIVDPWLENCFESHFFTTDMKS